ncbi:hypothetical protein HPSNAG_0891 [Glaesserella parasuis str. Nagasaki]|nr:hypothetical protein HPSNAG_0891 [Glaesserella parasuis str. Nagasaki]
MSHFLEKIYKISKEYSIFSVSFERFYFIAFSPLYFLNLPP